MSKAIESKTIKESDLFQPVSTFFIDLGYSVKGEVKGCDITAVKDDELLIIELKKGITINLLAQGVDRQKVGDLVYLAVPKPKGFKMNSSYKKLLHLLRRLELGLIFVNFKARASMVEVILEAGPFDRQKSMAKSQARKGKLMQEHQNRKNSSNLGGVNKTKLLTVYREKALEIAYILRNEGPLKLSDIIERTSGDKKIGTMLRLNHYGWFFKQSRGVYGITEAGEEGLQEFSDFVQCFLHKEE